MFAFLIKVPSDLLNESQPSTMPAQGIKAAGGGELMTQEMHEGKAGYRWHAIATPSDALEKQIVCSELLGEHTCCASANMALLKDTGIRLVTSDV